MPLACYDPGPMAGRALVFVNDARAAARADRAADVVVLDPAYVRGPVDPPTWTAVSDLVAPILEAHDLVNGSLDLLDEWAARAGLPAAFTFEAPRGGCASGWPSVGSSTSCCSGGKSWTGSTRADGTT